MVGAFTAAATLLEKSVGLAAETTRPAAGTAPVPEAGWAIGIGDLRYALTADRTIDLSGLFGNAGVPPGCAGAITATPFGSLRITNSGTSTWAVSGRDGIAETVPPGSGFAVTDGTRIVLGGATIDIEPY